MINSFTETPVFVFYYEERTLDFCIFCLEELGFKNIIIIDGETPFYEKLIQFSRIAHTMSHDFFIRTDADRFIFEGIFDLLKKFTSENIDSCHGYCFDYLMNAKRGGTPHIYSKNLISKMVSGEIKILNNNKPETHIQQQLKDFRDNKDNYSRKTFNILTNLHDYEQSRSKIANTFTNRLYRGNKSLYDWSRLRNVGYKEEVDTAFKYFKDNQVEKDCNYLEIFKKFDKNTKPLTKDLFPELYQKYLKRYTEKI
jgi:hypothetical protein